MTGDVPRKRGDSPGADRAFRASYLLAGVEQEKVFDALLDVRSFTKWGRGLRRAWLLDDAREVRTGAVMGFELSAAGFTHEVTSAVTVVEEPRVLEWRYTSGAVGGGGWLVERESADAIRMTFSTDYEVRPAWLNRIAHRPFFKRVAEDLLRRSVRSLGQQLRSR